MNFTNKILIVGLGNMSIEYAAVLSHLNVDFTPVGRGEASAKSFTDSTGIPAVLGGLEQFIDSFEGSIASHAIVCLPIDALHMETVRLIKFGVKNILVEKPAGLTSTQINNIVNHASQFGCKVFVAYNRRFFSSVVELQKRIEQEGGLMSFSFDFTEWSDSIKATSHNKEIKENWVLANSTHVIDLAFFLGGQPLEYSAHTSGSLDWHSRSSVFCGSGITEIGAIFNYHSNWASPGRWGLEFCTSQSRYVLKPMEKLQRVCHNSVEIEDLDVDFARFDENFKPGILLQTEAFLKCYFSSNLCSLEYHSGIFPVYEKIAGYIEP
jgi:predicted dehydrogenase